MKAFVIFAVVVAAVGFGPVFAEESCYLGVDASCGNSKSSIFNVPCNATYGHPNLALRELMDYANNHITRSYEYLLMATHYGNYEKNRVGFEKLFHSLSDEKWNTAIDIIKHVTKRGGTMKFNRSPYTAIESNQIYEIYEMQSIAKALDIEKQLATQAFHIHKQASHNANHDPEIATYIEKEFVHDQAHTIRKIAGHVTDLNTLLRSSDGSLALYLFDEYLKKA